MQAKYLSKLSSLKYFWLRVHDCVILRFRSTVSPDKFGDNLKIRSSMKLPRARSSHGSAWLEMSDHCRKQITVDGLSETRMPYGALRRTWLPVSRGAARTGSRERSSPHIQGRRKCGYAFLSRILHQENRPPNPPVLRVGWLPHPQDVMSGLLH